MTLELLNKQQTDQLRTMTETCDQFCDILVVIREDATSISHK